LTDGYLLDDDPACIDRDRLFGWLSSDAYWWSGGLDRQVLEAALDASITLSVLSPAGAFVGFGRLVTDRATFGYWCDVYIERQHRGRGLGQLLTCHALAHPAVATCRRILLATRDAHAVYERAGFSNLAHPEIFMEILRRDASSVHRPEH